MNKIIAISGAALAICLHAVPGHAQATRTWVSGVGADANPCSRTAPCQTFAGALSKTAAGGQISVLDPGGFGAVTINKSISITNDNSGEASILAAGVNGIVINTAGVVVHLRGLVIDGGTPSLPGLNGVRFLQGAALHIQNCVIRNFAATGTNGHGIQFAPSASAKLTVRDTHVARNGVGAAGGGIVVKPTGGFSSVTFIRVTMDNNSNGLVLDTTTTAGGVLATVSDSAASANTNTGIALIGGVGATQSFLVLDRVVSANNVNGIGSSGANSNVLLSNSAVSGNTTGLLVQSSGKIVSYLNNVLLGNTTQGAPTSTQAGQ